MKITILTLFPEFFSAITENTIIKRAISKEKVVLNIVNIREYTKDKHRRVDSAPIGGGAGLIMKCQPIVDALNLNSSASAHKILLSPRGKTFNQKMAESYSQLDELISTGDYVLTGGEIPSMLIVDSIVRLLDGVINRESIIDESFESGMLEYPQYTEPRNFEGYEVPEILYSGNHGKIDRFRYLQALKITKQYRPDLFEKLELSKKDIEELQEILENN